jgi:hypothetical protein
MRGDMRRETWRNDCEVENHAFGTVLLIPCYSKKELQRAMANFRDED